jgi:hypothetical protein
MLTYMSLAFLKDLWASRVMDCSIDPTAAQQGRVSRVYDCVCSLKDYIGWTVELYRFSVAGGDA